MDNLLEQSIPTEVSDFILKKMDEYKETVDANYRKHVDALEEQFESSTERLFAFADNLVEEAKDKLRKEYSAKMAAKIEEKNSQIDELQEELEDFKGQLAERVNAFLSNAKEDVRSIVEEEFRTDAEELKSQHVLEQVRDLVATDQQRIVSVEEGKVERLEADIEALKERVSQKSKVNESLKAKLHVAELLESVPEADRDFYQEQLNGAETISEADERFERIKNAVRRSRSDRLEEEFEDFNSKGESLNEADDFDADEFVTLDESHDNPFVTDRMRQLARS